MIRLQKIALAAPIVDDLPALKPGEVRAAWDLLAEDPTQTMRAIADHLEPRVAERALLRLIRLADFEAELARLAEKGIEPVLLGDRGYPRSWTRTLDLRAPSLFFSWGSRDLLSQKCIGIVGSRAIANEARDFARSAAIFATRLGYAIVSGGAPGADDSAMRAATGFGGSAIGIVTQLTKCVASFAREPKTCLISTFAPDAPFSVGNAMSRNKLIYAMATLTIVVQSDVGAGGTWTGAIEAISKRFGRVAAWSKGGDGCEGLIRRGAEPISAPAELPELIARTSQKSLFE